ncbi:aspartate aminotransferase family protein [Pseudonocardia sp. CA-107938]|uniref:aspartate aminotransferase family protein n=1 Tax=Pseudonocardia sp. CA-107938 TaxID=3240021 RepID=UPI003D9501B6
MTQSSVAAANDTGSAAAGPTAGTADLLRRRYATLGSRSPLFYSTPLEVVSGSGVWLTDADGEVYLDAYNNVPHVGHANPVVAAAVSEQMARLNLHTRYLNDRVVDYAEALLATFDAPLDRAFLTNSGSESNDLALRIARQHTGNTGVLVSDWSYHGNTGRLAELTTGLATGEGLAPYVRTLHIPDAAGVGDESALLAESLSEVDTAIASLVEAGHGLAAVVFDPLFSTEGLVSPPSGYVEGLAARVHAAGGLVLSDEVQSGFGRTGGRMWGYQMFDIEPDLVVLGKPMGNGHPLSALVTTARLQDEFGARNDYFNTFAGSPVSAAAGMAVLQVMAEENLLERSAQLGHYVSERLHEIVAGNPRVAAVRGRGLYFGLEFVDPADPTVPDAAATRWVVEDMRCRKVLISRIGPAGNVLKMRPPLVVTRSEIDILLGRLASSLEALPAG